jgi:arylsulfatase
VFASDIFQFGTSRPVFVYNVLEVERSSWRAPSGLDAGKQHSIAFDFKYNGPGLGMGGTGC